MAASGDVMVILAADLQDPPELIPEMLGKVEEGFEVVLAVRSQRDDGWLTVRLANIYHRLMRRYAIPDWPLQGADVFFINGLGLDDSFATTLKNSAGRPGLQKRPLPRTPRGSPTGSTRTGC